MIKLNVFNTNRADHVDLAKSETEVLFVHPHTNALTLGKLAYFDYGIDHVDVIIDNDFEDCRHFNHKRFNMFQLKFIVVSVETDE